MTEVQKVNKDDLADLIKDEFELSGAKSRELVDRLFEEIAKAMSERKEVSIYGFGKFTAKHRPERNGFNPSKKEHIVIPESYTPSFEAYKKLKDEVKG